VTYTTVAEKRQENKVITIAKQQLRKYATILNPSLDNVNMKAVEELLKEMFSAWYVQSLYNEE
jgi:hypothetical protein